SVACSSSPDLTAAEIARLPLVHIGPQEYRGHVCKDSEDSYHAHSAKTPQVHSPRNASPKSDPDLRSRLHSRKWLFPDIAGDRRPPRHLKGHRLRTPHHARRARSRPARSPQGTLFDSVEPS